MAKAFRLGLERTDMFIKMFTGGMTGDDWLQQPPGIPNPAIWTIGHLAFQRAGMLELLTGERTYDEEWVALFKMGCDPRDAGLYPDVDTCRIFLDARLRDLITYLDSATMEDLEGPPSLPSEFFKTRIEVLVHMTHHEAHHTGCLSLLRRLLGKERVI